MMDYHPMWKLKLADEVCFALCLFCTNTTVLSGSHSSKDNNDTSWPRLKMLLCEKHVTHCILRDSNNFLGHLKKYPKCTEIWDRKLYLCDDSGWGLKPNEPTLYVCSTFLPVGTQSNSRYAPPKDTIETQEKAGKVFHKGRDFTRIFGIFTLSL